MQSMHLDLRATISGGLLPHISGFCGPRVAHGPCCRSKLRIDRLVPIKASLATLPEQPLPSMSPASRPDADGRFGRLPLRIPPSNYCQHILTSAYCRHPRPESTACCDAALTRMRSLRGCLADLGAVMCQRRWLLRSPSWRSLTKISRRTRASRYLSRLRSWWHQLSAAALKQY